MAIIEVKVPQLSESITEATLLEWKKQVGEAVQEDEILIEIETDKVVMEVPAPAAGVLSEIVADSGAVVGSEAVIAKIDTEAKAAAQAAAAAAPAAAEAVVVAESKKAVADKGDVASPAAAKILAEKGLTAAAVSGSGKDGRVTKADALAAGSAAVTQIAAPVIIAQGSRPEERVPMSRLRARIAERLLQSQSSNALLTTFNEVNMQPLLKLRKLHQDRFVNTHGIKLGIMSFFVKAAVYALKKFPVVNASVDGTDIIYHGYYDIGVAVSSPRGLVVPIIRDADQLSFADIEKTIAAYAEKAREGKLTIEEMTGGTFTISNGGTFGSMLSTPIVNPPQSAILGIHATKDRAVVENGEIVIRPMNYLALTYDHRIIDGREAVLSLVAMKEALEDPTKILFEI